MQVFNKRVSPRFQIPLREPKEFLHREIFLHRGYIILKYIVKICHCNVEPWFISWILRNSGSTCSGRPCVRACMNICSQALDDATAVVQSRSCNPNKYRSLLSPTGCAYETSSTTVASRIKRALRNLLYGNLVYGHDVFRSPYENESKSRSHLSCNASASTLPSASTFSIKKLDRLLVFGG